METGQRNILVKKDNWWGENVKEKNIYFEANPKRLVYETINDFNTALVALKGGKLDVIYVTPVKDYLDLDESPKFKENFAKSEPPMLVYAYLGLNVRDKILKDVKVRQALAHLVDVDQIIEKVLYGLGTRVIGDVLPSHKDDYNNDLALYKYDVEKAKSLLSEAGWADSDGDGILDKVIDGQKTPFKLVYNYNAGNPVRETVGLLSQQWFKAVGIELSIVPLDWSLYLDELKKQKVQMWYGSWIQDPRDYDPRQIWHTESRNGGSNYTGYGNAASDQLIEDIEMIRSFLEEYPDKIKIEQEAKLRKGNILEIKQGPFAGRKVTVEKVKNEYYVVVQLPMLNRTVLMEVKKEDLLI